MIKIVLAIVVVVLLGYVGYGIEKYYKTRLNILNDYLGFIAFTNRETDFYKTSIKDLIDKYEYQSKHLKDILIDISNSNDSNNAFLSKEMILNIRFFLNELSKADYYFKNVVIKNAEEEAVLMQKTSEKDKTQKGELSRKLIILLGIGLIILII